MGGGETRINLVPMHRRQRYRFSMQLRKNLMFVAYASKLDRRSASSPGAGHALETCDLAADASGLPRAGPVFGARTPSAAQRDQLVLDDCPRTGARPSSLAAARGGMFTAMGEPPCAASTATLGSQQADQRCVHECILVRDNASGASRNRLAMPPYLHRRNEEDRGQQRQQHRVWHYPQ